MRRKKHAYTFEVLAKFIHGYLKEEGLTLNFKGYRDTIREYSRLEDNHIQQIFSVMNDLHLWNHYFIEIEHFINFKRDMYELELDYLKAFVNNAEPNETLENRINTLSEKVKHFRLFSKELKNQRVFFQKAFENCLIMYQKSYRNFAKPID